MINNCQHVHPPGVAHPRLWWDFELQVDDVGRTCGNMWPPRRPRVRLLDSKALVRSGWRRYARVRRALR